VDQDQYFQIKIDFYDHHDRHVKTALFEDIRQVKGQLYRPYKVTAVERIRKKTSTILLRKTLDIDTPRNDVLFTQSYMKRPVK